MVSKRSGLEGYTRRFLSFSGQINAHIEWHPPDWVQRLARHLRLEWLTLLL